MPEFSHLHVHTQYSLLDGASSIDKLVKKASLDGQKGIAITDHGNMFGAFEFVNSVNKLNKDDNFPNKLKHIIGCEFYLVDNRHKKQFTKDDKDERRHQIFLAKDDEGYRNLIKLCSLGYSEGLYSKYPRIDKELVEKYHKGLIATSCCLAGDVPRTILRKGEDEGEKVLRWWYDMFGEDYYIELQRHGIPEQDKVNEILVKFAVKYNIKIIASNDSHYVDQENYNAHDILLCINTGEKQQTPKAHDYGDEEGIQRGARFAFYNDRFYFKTKAEMGELFSDLPYALDNTSEIVDKVTPLKLQKDILLPNFVIPTEFQNQDDYLRHMTYEGARARYKEINTEIQERIDFELFTIKTMGFAGYFLIVSDFIKEGRNLGVMVGPGRGSAAGSVVAYCIGITNIDPIKYKLLFERFLNPDRKSMPDIDTDFDDEGRQKVINYVVEKYGRNQVAQIVTYGTMAAKMSIKDVARVMDLPLPESIALTKLVSDKPGIKLNRLLNADIDGEKGLKQKEGLGPEDIDNAKKLRDIMKGNDLQARVLKEALVLEGSVRNTGIHAAGIIIAPSDLMDILPVCTSKESELLITQFEGRIIEDAGVIKMDFLGLKTLSIIKDALILIKQNHGIDIDISTIPLDDAKTFELYQQGNTNGTFQFESPGMQKHLRDLKPDKFEDLIAMNALYRPGPMEYIPNYINRKHGREKISYDIEEMAEYLEETYGITVYQEQVMLLSQKLAGFTKGDADTLRKAMGKKQIEVLNKMESKFMEGAEAKGFGKDILKKIWNDWRSFAEYAFNKSHSTCYAYVAYQTAYLKAHYTAEYMAAVLTHNLNDIKKVTFFTESCKQMKIPVLGPDVNESAFNFTVNKKGEIRFGLGAIKGVGESAVEEIRGERERNGNFKSIFDFAERVILKSVNKKCIESLVLAGAFDCFEQTHRAQYFYQANSDDNTFLEKVLKSTADYISKKNSSQQSLFGDSTEEIFQTPSMPECDRWSHYEQLKKEKEVTGFYLSGHPLDEYRLEMQYLCTANIETLRNNLEKYKNQEVRFAGIISACSFRKTKNDVAYGSFTLEDYDSSMDLMMFSETFLKFKHFIAEAGMLVLIHAKVAERSYGTKEDPNNKPLEIRINTISLLAEALESQSRQIRAFVPLHTIDKTFIQTLMLNLKEYPGKFKLQFIVADEDKNKISLISADNKLQVNVDFLKKYLAENNIYFEMN